MFKFFEKRDSQVLDDVVSELAWDPSINSENIKVAAKDGIVTLTGFVPHFYEKASADKAAQRVHGVKAVVDEISVNLLSAFERSDEDIAKAALLALEWNYQVPDEMRVLVQKGWVTLQGEVDWEFQRKAAGDSVSQLMGVNGVKNKISIKTKVQSSDIKTRIEDALKRAAESESRNISVKVDGSKVTLSGKAHSFSEMDDAKQAAWNAPGVMNVENKLTLEA